jgi:hypothetical protein
MAFTETFTDDLSVSVGESTKASSYNNVSNNTDAVKERFAIGHFFNNTGVTNEDGFHKGNLTDPTWFYDKTKSRYYCFYIDQTTLTDMRFHIGSTTLAPTATQGQVIVAGLG